MLNEQQERDVAMLNETDIDLETITTGGDDYLQVTFG